MKDFIRIKQALRVIVLLALNLLVFQTEPGLAPAVAYKIDGLQLGSIVGTVAGENTLLAVVAAGHDARKVRKELWNRIQEA